MQISEMAARRAELARSLESMSRVAQRWEVDHVATRARSVKAHVRYGGRGNLSDFLLECVKAAFPHPLGSQELLRLTEQHFELKLSTPELRRRYYENSLRCQLRDLARDGNVVRVRLENGRSTGWVWKTSPTLSEIIAEEASRAASGDTGEQPWP